MKDAFSSYHPIVNFTYFFFVLLFSMFFMHPVFLGISLVCSFVYSLYLNREKAAKFNFLVMLPGILLLALFNPIFNHEGATILLYINDNPLTLESIVYGVAAAVMLVSVIVWFSCYNAVMTSDKFIYLFGRVIPALSLILSMVLRFVPKFKAQAKQISNAQRAIGRDISSGNIFARIRHGTRILSILTTWALENAVETADSMKSRGYGLKGRTSFSNYRFSRRDGGVLLWLAVCSLVILAGSVLGENNIVYFPAILVGRLTWRSVVIYLIYALFLLTPTILNLREDAKWSRLQSRI